jgi:hypothetical protein
VDEDILCETGTFLGEGRHRRVYGDIRAYPFCLLGHDYVIKVPYRGGYLSNDSGLSANYREHTLSLKYGYEPNIDGVVFAYSRILPNGWLVMERVDPTYIPAEHRPKWADYVDGRQVGRNKKGMIVAYDYATGTEG